MNTERKRLPYEELTPEERLQIIKDYIAHWEDGLVTVHEAEQAVKEVYVKEPTPKA